MSRYTWFISAEDVPKNMNESVADSVLSTLAADAVLRTTRSLLQKMNIALDRVAIQLQTFRIRKSS